MGTLLGPVLTGVLFGAGLQSVWVVVVVSGMLLAALLVLRLRPLLTPAQDGVLEAAPG